MKCPGCDADLGPEYRFCGLCGCPVASAAESGTDECGDSSYWDAMASSLLPSAPAVAEWIIREFKPSSVAGVGRGTAVYLARLQQQGVDALGIDQAHAGPDLIVRYDLRQPLPIDRRFDVAIFLEAAARLTQDFASILIESLCALADTLIFSAASLDPHRGLPNEQPWEQWLSAFWQAGYELDVVRTARLRKEWAAVGAPDWLCNDTALFLRSPRSPGYLAHALRLVEMTEGCLSPPEAQLLFGAARQTPKAAAIVQVGAGRGRATAALGLGAVAGFGAPIFAVDHHRGNPGRSGDGNSQGQMWSWPEFYASLKTLRLEHVVRPVLQDALVAEAAWDGTPIGLLCFEGDRDYERLASEFAAWSRHVSTGGIIAVQDTTSADALHPVVQEAVAEGHLRSPMRVGSITYALAAETIFRSEKHRCFPPLPARRQQADRISLIMPTRNEGDYVRRTIDNLMANTFYPDFEVLILDDASDDGSCDFLKLPPYVQDERLRLTRAATQQGHLALRIMGAERATGSVLQFLDAHHSFSPYWLSNLYDSLRRRNFQALVGPVIGPVSSETWQLTGAISFGWGMNTTFTRIWHFGQENIGPDCRIDWLGACQIMVAREAHDAIGGLCPLFRVHGDDDRDFCMRAYLFGYDCFIEPTAVLGHVYRDGFINPITFGDVMCNYFVLVYLNLGEDAFNELRHAQRDSHGFAEGLELFESLRPQVEEFRAWIVKHQRRSSEKLLERLIRHEPLLT